MALSFFLFLLFSLTSATATNLFENRNDAKATGNLHHPHKTVISVDSHNFFVPTTVIPVDSRNFFVPTVDTNVIPVDSRNFFVPTVDTNVIPVDSRNFFVPTVDTNAIPVDSRNFFVPTVHTNAIPVKPVDSRNFFVPTVHTNAIPVKPVDTRNFFVPTTNKPSQPDKTAFPGDSRNYFVPAATAKTTLQAHNEVSYCSVYFKKDNLKEGTTICPLFSRHYYTTKSICKQNTTEGEREYRFCASSYEVMAKKANLKLGKDFKVVSSDKVEMKTCTMLNINKVAEYGKSIVCHKERVLNAVSFYCHQLSKSSVYILSVREKGRVANKVGVCHEDTTGWNPKRFVFQVLHVKPGMPVCHLLPSEDLAWVVMA